MNVNSDLPRALSIQPKLLNISLATSRPHGGRRLFSKVYPSSRNRNISIVGQNYKTIVSVTYERGDSRLTSVKGAVSRNSAKS